MSKQGVHIYAVIDGQTVSRQQILEKENARYATAIKTLGLKTKTVNPNLLKKEILDAKLQMGPARLKKRLRTQLAISKPTIAFMARLSHGKRSRSSIDFYAEGISAKAFIEWFERQCADNNFAAMLQAHPEHYVIDTHPDGTQHICETIGGSSIASEFSINFKNTGAVTIPMLEDHPHRIEGVSVLASGQSIGGARHQFQDTPKGLHGVLCIDFPKLIPSFILNGHKWHLAIEFSNWVEAAVSGQYDQSRENEED